MKTFDELFDEVSVRFDTDPKRYTKKDFYKLLELIQACHNSSGNNNSSEDDLPNNLDEYYLYYGNQAPTRLSLFIKIPGNYAFNPSNETTHIYILSADQNTILVDVINLSESFTEHITLHFTTTTYAINGVEYKAFILNSAIALSLNYLTLTIR